MKKLWYYFFKIYIRTGLFFYTKKIKIVGKKNIPKKGAVLFAVNHPNGLLDPLVVTTNTPRVTHFLVRASIFKKPLIKKLLATLNLMPIYRIRDGVKELSKNTEVFNDCYEILNKQQALMIYPEGSHDSRRTIRNLSKGFTRILFGAFEKYPTLNITIIPVGVTYQKVGVFPNSVAICYGTPIIAKEFYNSKDVANSINTIKEEVSNQLKELSVHIPADENYEKTLDKLNALNVDFTNVKDINNNLYKGRKKSINFIKPIYYLLVLNSIFPWVIWKIIKQKIEEIEFIDTFRFGLGISLFPIFYLLQTFLVFLYFGKLIALLYFIGTIISTLLYSKLSPIPSE